MKLNIEIGGANFRLFAEASSLSEFTELRDYLQKQGFIGGINTPAAAAATQGKAPPAEEVKADSKPAATEAKTAPAATTAKGGKGNAKGGATAAATAKTAAGPTIEEVTAVLTAVADKFGVPEALIMNQRFGVKKAGELKPDQYADYIKFAKHCVDDDAAPSSSHTDFDGDGSEGGEDDVSNLV